MEALKWIIFAVLVIVAGAIIIGLVFGGKDSLFESVKSAFESVVNVLPEVGTGAKVQEAEHYTLLPSQQQNIDSLKKAIEELKGKKDCFVKYGDFNLGEKDLSINFEEVEGTYKLIIKKKGIKSQEMEDYDLSPMKPCVIEGQNYEGTNIAENFYHNFLNNYQYKVEGTTLLAQKFPYYRETKAIEITNSGSKNLISYYSYGDYYVKDAEFNDGGWLFTPNGKDICFFPTKTGEFNCDGDTLLDDDCLTDSTEENTIPYLYSKGKLPLCNS